MAPLSDYVTGTITLTNGSAAFTGSGTGWLAAAFREGDTVLGIEGNPGVTYVIESITDNDAGTLTQPWDGPTGTYEYRMRYLSDGQRVTAQARTLIELLGNGNLQALAGLSGTPNTLAMFTGAGAMVEVARTDLVSGANYDVQVDTLPDRDAYDGQDAGFAVLVANTGDGRSAIYSKNSATSGDWSDPAYVTGPAVTLDVGSVTPVAFGNDPDVTLTPVAGGYEFDFELPENATFQSGTITTLDPGEDATFSLSPVAGGYALNLGVPRGPTGDIDGVTSFWQSRITVDTTAAQARAGLGLAGFGIGDSSSVPNLNLDTAEWGFSHIPPGSTGVPVASGWPLHAITLRATGTSGRIQIGVQPETDRAFLRSYVPSSWAEWRELWHSGSMPVASQAEIEVGTGTDPRAVTPQRIAQAIAALAPEVPVIYKRSNILGTVSQSGSVPTGAIIERGSNANGEYVKFADGTQVCWGSPATGAITTPSGGIFMGTSVNVTFPAVFVGLVGGYGGAYGVAVWGGLHEISTTGAIYRAYCGVSTPSGTGGRWLAIGRWF